MDASPYLSAIQSLSGEIPGEKYKDLHAIAAQIIKSEKERSDFLATGTTERIHPALAPHLRVLVGNKLKLVDVVIEALKSDDVLIIKQALGAKWFFNPANEYISADYFIENVVPYVSLRTRLELIKTLAHYLVGHQKKADEFFGRLADLYGTEKALPLIVACSESYIFEVVIKRKIVLPSRILGVLYRRYPQLVIRYLQLGNDGNDSNAEDRKLLKIHLFHYVGFLPALVKTHTQDFVELYECLPQYRRSIRLGSTRAEFFLKNGTELLIKKPGLLLDLLPLKLVSNKLSTQQFETMFENLFPKDESKFNGVYLESKLRYYPQEKKFNLLEEKYKLLYGNSVLDNKGFYFESWLFKLLPVEKKESYARKIIAPIKGTDKYLEKQDYLPPREAIPQLIDLIGKTSSTDRMTFIRNMINSCSLYDSKDDLLRVLQYYNSRHKNERSEVLYVMLGTLVTEIDIKTLDKSHWQIIWEIIQRAYVKGDLFSEEHEHIIRKLFDGALNYYLKQCKADEAKAEAKQILDKLIGVVIECCMEHKLQPSFIKACPPELRHECLQKFLAIVPLKYAETCDIWNKYNNKLKFVQYLVESIHNINVKNMFTEKRNKRKCKSGATITDFDGNEVKQKKLWLRDYSWLLQLSVELFRESLKCRDYKKSKLYLEHKRTVLQHDSELYQSIIDSEPDLINDIESFDALHLLKNDRSKVLGKCSLYLNACRNKLDYNNKAAKNFVSATKWHQEIPIRFAKQCMSEIRESGSTLVLGILLEGSAFGKVIERYLPKEKIINLKEEDAKKNYQMTSSLPKAINFCNPPVSFDILAAFCQGDYVKLAAHTLTSVAQRVPVNQVVAFANTLVDKPISVKKLGIRLVFQVSSKTESREFLSHIWSIEKNSSIREVVAKMIFDVFTQTPNDETWQLIKVCINGLTSEDKVVLEILNRIDALDKQYICQYVGDYLQKIDSFGKDINNDNKLKLIRKLVDQINVNILQYLSEELITDIIKRDFFNYTDDFKFSIYLFSEPAKFDERLKIFMEIVTEKFDDYGKSDPENHRAYPVNKELRKFFRVVFCEAFARDNKEMAAKLVDASLTLILAKLKPWQDMKIFIYAHLAKDYTESSTLKDFGAKLADTVARLVYEFKSDIILDIISKFLNERLTNWCHSRLEQFEQMFSVIESLTEKEPRLGALVGINMLEKWHVNNYDKRYDALVKKWAAIEDPIVLATLNDFQNDV